MCVCVCVRACVWRYGAAGRAQVVTLERRPDGVAVVTINNPPVNSLSIAMRKVASDRPTMHPVNHRKHPQGLAACTSAAIADSSVRALVITGTGAAFVGGADIKEMSQGKLGGPILPMFNTV